METTLKATPITQTSASPNLVIVDRYEESEHHWTTQPDYMIVIKWISFWNNILVLVCPRQKWLSPNVSNSSKIIQGSLMGPISVHLRGLLPIQGPQEGSEAIFWPYFGILNNFPHFLWMNNFIEYSGLRWMKIFLNKYFGFCFELNFELNHFSARFNEKMNFQNVSPIPTLGRTAPNATWYF